MGRRVVHSEAGTGARARQVKRRLLVQYRRSPRIRVHERNLRRFWRSFWRGLVTDPPALRIGRAIRLWGRR